MGITITTTTTTTITTNTNTNTNTNTMTTGDNEQESTDDPDLYRVTAANDVSLPVPNEEYTEPAHQPGDEHWGGKGRDIHYAYPDYHSYDRSGNGHTSGDKHPWVFAVSTNDEGDGEFLVRFPEPAHPSGDPPGAENWKPIDSWVVWVAFAKPVFGFGKYKDPIPTRTFMVANYQRTYWLLKFKGPPNSSSLMSLMRFVNFAGDVPWRGQVPVRDGTEHGDL